MVRQNTDNRWIAKMNERLLHGSPKRTRARCTLAEMLATLVRFAIPVAGVDKALHKEIFVKKIKKLEKINFITNKNK
jgi:predicted GIY-YIG superfamily endonuclease